MSIDIITVFLKEEKKSFCPDGEAELLPSSACAEVASSLLDSEVCVV